MNIKHFPPEKLNDNFCQNLGNILENYPQNFAKFWVWSGAKVFESCRSRKMLQNAYLDVKIGVDTEEIEPSKVDLISVNVVTSLIIGPFPLIAFIMAFFNFIRLLPVFSSGCFCNKEFLAWFQVLLNISVGLEYLEDFF